MKKILLLLLSSLILTSCSSEVSFWAYLFGDREKDGLIYRSNPAGDTIVEFTTDLQDDEIIYIPAFFSTYWSGEPRPIIIGGTMRNAESDTLKILYMTGVNVSYGSLWYRSLPNLQYVVLNGFSINEDSLLSLSYVAFSSWTDSGDKTLEFIYEIIVPFEEYEKIRQFYISRSIRPDQHPLEFDNKYFVYKSSRATYYFNYDDSPNAGLYRIGMEYELGSDLTPPEIPTRIKQQSLLGTEYYNFLGWSSDASTFIPYDFESSEEERDVQLFAHWE